MSESREEIRRWNQEVLIDQYIHYKELNMERYQEIQELRQAKEKAEAEVVELKEAYKELNEQHGWLVDEILKNHDKYSVLVNLILQRKGA